MNNECCITVKVLFFAQSKELAGVRESSICLPEKISYKQLLQLITDNFNLTLIKNNILLAKNEEVCAEHEPIELKAGVGVRSMGDHLLLTPDKLSVEAASELVAHESCGAISMFVGTTRDHFDGRKVIRLEYEAYEAMALKALKSLCSDMRGKWPDIHGIAIHHRLGHVAAREASVVIAVSSAHRRESLEAVAHCIDQLKATVPVWKKEIYDDQPGGNSGAWKQNAECATKKRKAQPIETETIDKSLIQVNVSYEELESRINNFIKRKREQVNLSNIHDFIPSEGEATEADENTCARVRTVFTKRSDSKGHLKVHRVNNEWGPQTVRQAAQPNKPDPPSGSLLPPGVEERVLDVERFLNIRSVTPDVYKRLKEMEDRIRHLESISPEYAAFWRCNSGAGASGARDEAAGERLRWRYTTDEIDKKIEQLEKQNSASWT